MSNDTASHDKEEARLTVTISAENTERLKTMAAVFRVDVKEFTDSVLDEIIDAYCDSDSGFAEGFFAGMVFPTLREAEQVMDNLAAFAEQGKPPAIRHRRLMKKVEEGWQLDIEASNNWLNTECQKQMKERGLM